MKEKPNIEKDGLTNQEFAETPINLEAILEPQKKIKNETLAKISCINDADPSDSCPLNHTLGTAKFFMLLSTWNWWGNHQGPRTIEISNTKISMGDAIGAKPGCVPEITELLPKHGLTRADVFITTKFHMDPEDPAGGARKLVLESLKQLRVSYLDMVLIHYPKAIKCDEKDTKNKEHRKLTYLELEKMKAEGKIRSVGVSNYEVYHMEEIKSFSKMVPCTNQVEFHPHLTREELRQYCRKEGIFLQAFSSLARFEPALIQEPILTTLAKKNNVTIAVILLSWAMSQGVGVIPKSSIPTQLTENFEATKLVLKEEEIESLRKLNRNKNYIDCAGWRVL
ncbi:hypothetical protein Y032_0059g2970 [Ancylostoma ceylanicum]|uniref:NADP-dependent oxidoreductase domain-containing protein n=1 Tax=Ancylostoma ceylanicum TaxID=53326 RepID=A0A016U3D5_9BILA|nr:hypothetical protein Y032_0059g2970 [Ancylostoma ceylanicum]